MAVDKLVDSTQLDSDLTSVANAIRAKSGGSNQLAFPSGFVSEIGNIPSGGGGYNPYNLPSGYTPYEYIEATGTQYINTGYVPTIDTEVVFTSLRTSVQSYNASDFGVRGGPNALYSGSYFRWGSAADKQASNLNADIPYGPQTLRVNKNGVYDSIGNLRGKFGTITWTSGTYAMYLFCGHVDGSAARFSKVKIYYFCATENNVKKIELVPAMRNSDSALCFYDLVSDAFFTNAGSGTFTGGAFT